VGLSTAYYDLMLFDVMQPCTYHRKKCASVVEGKLEEGLGRRYSPRQNVTNPALFMSHDTKITAVVKVPFTLVIFTNNLLVILFG